MSGTAHQQWPLPMPCLGNSHLLQTVVLSLPMQVPPPRLAWVQSLSTATLSLLLSLALLSPWWFWPQCLILLGVMWHLLSHPCLGQPAPLLMEMTQSPSSLQLLQFPVTIAAPCPRPLSQMIPSTACCTLIQ